MVLLRPMVMMDTTYVTYPQGIRRTNLRTIWVETLTLSSPTANQNNSSIVPYFFYKSGPCLDINTDFPGMEIPITNIRRSLHRPIFIKFSFTPFRTKSVWIFIQAYSFISHYICLCIKYWCLNMSVSQNTYTILYRYCTHTFYHCSCFHHGLYFACYLLSGNSSRS